MRRAGGREYQSILGFCALLVALGPACAQRVAVDARAAHRVENLSRPTAPVTPALSSAVLIEENFGAWGIDLTGMADDIHPGDDIHRYVSGRWLAQTQIPGDRSTWGSFDYVAQSADLRTEAIVTASLEHARDPASPYQLIGALFASWMNSARIAELGLSPVRGRLAAWSEMSEHSEIRRAMLEPGITAPFAIDVIVDPRQSGRHAVYIGQSGLGLPGRKYYLGNSERLQSVRADYSKFIELVLTELGLPRARARARALLELETRLARVHWPQEQTRDIAQRFNRYTLDAADEAMPNLAIRESLSALGLSGFEECFIGQPSALTAIDSLFAEVEIELWRDYLSFHHLRSSAPMLSAKLADAHFDFFHRTLKGTQRPPTRVRTGVELVNAHLGELVGRVYVDEHFPATSKAQLSDMVAGLCAALGRRIENSTWMDPRTKTAALDKLAKMEAQIGYPDAWTGWQGLTLDADDLYGNMARLRQHAWRVKVRDATRGVNRGRWARPPQTINAWYHPILNQITFAAGILQPPIFDPSADAAVNYGAIGAIIGHEIGHGFDDAGRRFDGVGRVRDWWTPRSSQRFESLAARLGRQYAAYTPLPGLQVNAQLTMGENIGDLGGVEMAYSAYLDYVETHHQGQAPVLDGFTGVQRFFLAYAQAHRRMHHDGELTKRVLTDPHSPPEFRINGVVRNVDAWYEAFNVGPSHALYLSPDERVSIW